MKLCEADIHAIEIRNEITQDQKRYQPPHHLTDYTLFQIMHGRNFPFFLSFGTSGSFGRVQSVTFSGGFFARPVPKALRRNIRIPVSRRHAATGLGRSLTSVIH